MQNMHVQVKFCDWAQSCEYDQEQTMLRNQRATGIARSVAGNKKSLPALLISYIRENLQQTPWHWQNVWNECFPLKKPKTNK